MSVIHAETPAGRKEAGRAKILASAGRGFRRHGFGGVGVDALAQEAGVTSGAFYAHFKSKAEAFRATVSAGLAGFRQRVDSYQEHLRKELARAICGVLYGRSAYLRPRRQLRPAESQR